ncbi:Uncharacterised protein [Candidatus Bilamarchaeum dharawalense]|uniref:Uncharacterized protein n=1 Tax=Candidatus Bilamarchaeum dharawalense TaxID=2885759 RepID=A0A5E4LQR8_9ARCH|nr:Uncharacterised protein [Candidatus Bilamarchaeum dharawalense]
MTRISRDVNRVRSDVAHDVSKANGFRNKALLGVGTLLVAGTLSACGGTTNNYYYGGDSEQTDAGSTDVSTCKSGPKLTCGDTAIQKYVRLGQTLDVEELHFTVSDVGQDSKGKFVVFGVSDPNCDEINSAKVYQGEAINVVVSVWSFTVSMVDTYYVEGKSSGAILKVEATCEENPECTPNIQVPACMSNSYGSGVLNQGESVPIGSLKLQLDDLETHDDSTLAIFSILDNCGNVIKKDKVAQGETKDMVVDGKVIRLTVSQLSSGDTFAAKWAKIDISVPCEASDCTQAQPEVSGLLNQGESLTMGAGMKVQLDDLANQNDGVYAIISILDSQNNVLKKSKIKEGASLEMSIAGEAFVVTVNQVASGDTFAAKWADITVSRCPPIRN